MKNMREERQKLLGVLAALMRGGLCCPLRTLTHFSHSDFDIDASEEDKVRDTDREPEPRKKHKQWIKPSGKRPEK